MPTFIPFEFPKSSDGQYTAVLSVDRILFNRRIKLGLTQQEVSDMAGIQLRQYQRLETGESLLSKTTAENALSICTVLMLDPFEMIKISATHPDPSTLQPQDSFDTEIPDSGRVKHAGRRPIRRDIMTIYFNHHAYSVMIPVAVMEQLGKPSFIALRWIEETRRFFFCTTSAGNPDGIDVPPQLYNGKTTALVFTSTPLFDKAKRTLHWGKTVYAVESRIVKDHDGVPNILCELDTAQPSEKISGPFVIPSCMAYASFFSMKKAPAL